MQQHLYSRPASIALTDIITGMTSPDTSSRLTVGITPTVLKSSMSLDLVENTRLSTWLGSTNVTTLGLVSAVSFTNAAIKIQDTDASNTLTLAAGSNLTADRVFTLITGDANRQLTLSGDATLGNWFDQSVKTTGTPSFTSVFLAAGTTSSAPLRIAQGVAPTTPTNGDVWTTSSGLYVQIAGGTVGPLGAGGGGGATGANPSASIGLAAVNGSAGTFLRSDGAPALSQAIVPTWSAVHTFSSQVVLNAGASFSGGGTITGSSGALTFAAAGTNQNVNVTPIGTGLFQVNLTSTGYMYLNGSAGAALIMNAATGSQSNIVYRINSVDKGQLAVAGATNAYITGTALGDMIFYGNGATVWLAPTATAANAWKVNTSGQLSTTGTTAASSTSTGTLVTAGGAGIAGALYVGGNVVGGATVSDVLGDLRLLPQNPQSAAYTLLISDAGKHLLHPAADTTARIWTIPANASVAYPVGTAITFVNQNAGGVITINITSDTMRLAGAGTTGSRTLAANGIATALKITSTEWIISGTGLT